MFCSLSEGVALYSGFCPYRAWSAPAALPGVSFPSVACPGLQANPPSSGLGWPSAIPSNPQNLPASLLAGLFTPLSEIPTALGNSIPSRWESNSQPLGIMFPALGNRSTSRGHSMYQPPAIELPALGNRIASPWQWHCQPPAIRLPSPVATTLPDCVANAGPPPGQSA